MKNEEQKGENRSERKTLLDILLDDENRDPIVLIDQCGGRIAFEQIAVIPHNEKVYAVLKPVDRIEGIEDDEAVVFYVEERGDEQMLMVETDESTALDVFNKYYDLLEET